MSESTAEMMVRTLRDALADNPAGVSEITFADGRRTKYDRQQLLEELRYWENVLAGQNGVGMVAIRQTRFKGYGP